jgi:hypothetical protein
VAEAVGELRRDCGKYRVIDRFGHGSRR